MIKKTSSFIQSSGSVKSIKKELWVRPKITQLKVSDTLSGTTLARFEDDAKSEHPPVS